MTIFGTVNAWFRAILDLLAPRGCAGCGRPDEVLCHECEDLLHRCLVRHSLPGSRACCYACGWYRGAVRSAILAWKDHGDEECDGPLSAALADLVRMVLLTDRPGSKRVVLVPAPSSRASMRRRGRWQMLPVARKMKSVLCDSGFEAEVRPALRLVGVRGKSVQTAGSSARSDRITGHVRLVDGVVSGIGADATVVVVDDIVTTGSTMGQCAHVLETACDARVVGAALVMTPVDSSSA